MLYKARYKRLLEKCKKQEAIIKRYVASEEELEEERNRLNKLIDELEETKRQWAEEIAAMKLEHTKYTETVRELMKIKKQLFKDISKGG